MCIEFPKIELKGRTKVKIAFRWYFTEKYVSLLKTII